MVTIKIMATPGKRKLSGNPNRLAIKKKYTGQFTCRLFDTMIECRNLSYVVYARRNLTIGMHGDKNEMMSTDSRDCCGFYQADRYTDNQSDIHCGLSVSRVKCLTAEHKDLWLIGLSKDIYGIKERRMERIELVTHNFLQWQLSGLATTRKRSNRRLESMVRSGAIVTADVSPRVSPRVLALFFLLNVNINASFSTIIIMHYHASDIFVFMNI